MGVGAFADLDSYRCCDYLNRSLHKQNVKGGETMTIEIENERTWYYDWEL